MNQTLKNSSPLTYGAFKKELNHEFKKRLDPIWRTLNDHTEVLQSHTQAISRLSVQVIHIHDRLDRMEQNMATKDDIRQILNTMDILVRRSEIAEGKYLTHDLRLNDHEHRIASLEASVRKTERSA